MSRSVVISISTFLVSPSGLTAGRLRGCSFNGACAVAPTPNHFCVPRPLPFLFDSSGGRRFGFLLAGGFSAVS
jgi:hypothetical protein